MYCPRSTPIEIEVNSSYWVLALLGLGLGPGYFASLTTALTNMTNSHTTDRHHHQRPNKKRMSNHCGGDGVLSTALCDPIWIW